MAKARRSLAPPARAGVRFSPRRFWNGAAARMVASKAMSAVLPSAGRALM
jgi:hypothetical protein